MTEALTGYLAWLAFFSPFIGAYWIFKEPYKGSHLTFRLFSSITAFICLFVITYLQFLWVLVNFRAMIGGSY
ncbi:hypothetical protein [Lysobacter sp. N42]|uniref:hypothetical protein n=1 Tax=Lysobacter sp. N42 TaxID=2545719 RepID=UPI001047A787|nr:hypothetical protein [Lysobacter sp. N42]TCZ89464.1 hypothetical protein EYQ95_11295 [Lysobacter sp. N42]